MNQRDKPTSTADHSGDLLRRVVSRSDGALDLSTESAWIEVIHHMDETYAELLRHQVQLEDKNAALEDAQRFIASVLASMTDVLIACDTQGRIQQVNHALEQLTGISREELVGRPFQTLFTRDCQSLVSGFAQKIREDAIHDCEIVLQGRDENMPLAMNCSSRYDHRGRLVGMVLIGRPVGELRKAYEALNRAHAELKQAQQQLISAEKMASLGRLVAGVAHELNNPISFVYGNVHALERYAGRLSRYIETVHREGIGPEQASARERLRVDSIIGDLESLIHGTLEASERVRDIVEDLRRFSSGQQGEHTRFDLAHTVRTATHWVIKGVTGRIEVAFEMPEQLVVVGHPGQIHQVVMNLVQNAVDASLAEEGREILIRLFEEGDHVRFEIRDRGAGVAESDLIQLFDPFFTTKPVGQGTGLGLSISFGIVKDHGGRIWAENPPGGGALFAFELPRPAAVAGAREGSAHGG